MTGCRDDLAEFKMTNLERGLLILELLVDYPEGLGTSEMSRILDLPKNFIFRATSVLHLKGYLDRNEDAKTFSLSRKLLSMSFHVLNRTSLLEVAMPLMRELRNEVKETVTLCAVEETQGIVLDHVPSPHAMRLVVETGAHFNLHASAPGKAMMAFYEPEDLDRLIAALRFERFTSTTITTEAAFRQELLETKARGYSIDSGEELEGIHCVAAPVFDERRQVIAALVITGPTLRVKKEMLPDLGRCVSDVAAAISTRLGNAK